MLSEAEALKMVAARTNVTAHISKVGAPIANHKLEIQALTEDTIAERGSRVMIYERVNGKIKTIEIRKMNDDRKTDCVSMSIVRSYHAT